MKLHCTYRDLRLVLLLVVFTTIFGCKANKLDKAEANAKDLAILQSLSNQDDYFIAINAAFPFNSLATAQVINQALFPFRGSNASRIELGGDNNYILVQNDSTGSYLPFFGERRLNAGTYGGTDLAIQFDGTINNYEKIINKAKRKLVVKYSTNQKGDDSDSYDVIIEIFPNEKVAISIVPIHRTLMRYTGQLKPEKVLLSN